MINNAFSSLGLDNEEVSTYLTLIETGPITATNLAKKIGVPRPSIYGFLKKLAANGLVSESQKIGVKMFQAENPDKVNLLFEQQKEKLLVEQNEYQKILPYLRSQKATKYINPKLQLFEGVDGLKNVLKDMLLYKDMDTQAFWPIKKMVEVLSPDFFRYLNKERIKRNLYTRAIWPDNEVVEIKKHPYLGSGKEFKREIRIAPKEIGFSMGYWIYGNKVAFISSRKESFGFILESPEFVEMLLSQFEVIWKLSKLLKINPLDTEVFLKDLNRDI